MTTFLMANNGAFRIDFKGDYGYEMSEGQRAELTAEFERLGA